MSTSRKSDEAVQKEAHFSYSSPPQLLALRSKKRRKLLQRAALCVVSRKVARTREMFRHPLGESNNHRIPKENNGVN